MITYKIRLEMAGGREQYSNMEFTTGDVQAYRLEFDFMDNGKAYDCTGHTLTVKAKRSDGSVVVDSGTVENGKAFYIPANSVFSKPDALELEVALVTADGSYATVKVIHAHVREGFGDGDVTPEDTTPILVNLIAQGEYAKQMGDYAKEQGEWVGEASDAHINDNVRHITSEERAGWNNKVDKVEGKGLSTNDYTDAEKAKLAGVAPEATKTTIGSSDGKTTIHTQNVGGSAKTAFLYPAAVMDEKLAEKVDKVTGKGLSTNDYTTAEKEKLAGIEAEAQKNVVTSVAGKTGAVALDKSDVGLGNLTNDKQAKETDFNAHVGNTSNPHNVTKEQLEIENVDNTSDMDKPVSTAQAAALALKADKAEFDAHNADEERHITPQERARWDASAIVGDASGEKIVLDDVAPQGVIRELEIYGKSEQETSTQGKNLLDTTGIGVGSNFDNYVNDVTFESQADGGVKVTGTTMNEYSPYSTRFELIDKLTVGKTYVKSMTGGVDGISFVVAVTKNDNTSTRPTTFTLDDTIKSVKAYLEITKIDAPIDTTVYLQVEEGSTATAYEPFVPNKPSPEYPSEIKSAENFTALFLRGKNLLDTSGMGTTAGGITYTPQADGSVKVAGTSTGFGSSKLIDITSRLTLGKKYVKSMKGGVSGLTMPMLVTPKTGSATFPSTFTMDDTIESVKVYLQVNSADIAVDTTVYLQVEEGSVATAYEPYGGTVVNIPYELRGVPNSTGGWLARDYIEVKDGAVKLVRECAEKTFNGTEGWYYAAQNTTESNYLSVPDGKGLSYLSTDFRTSHYKMGNPIANVPRATNISSEGKFVPGFYNVKNTFGSVTAWKTYLAGLSEADNPLTILYQLATPTVEDITDTETGQKLLALTLTAPDAALSNTAASGMAVKYEVDGTIAYKKQESRLSARIAALEAAIINNI